MKAKYESPELQIVVFKSEDIVTTSMQVDDKQTIIEALNGNDPLGLFG